MAKKAVLGIDIGYDQLKLALVSNGEVVNSAVEQMPENLLKEGRFTSLEAMASLIRQTMEDNGIKATQAAVVLPNEHVYVKNVDMPMMEEEQLAYNLPFEFHDYITGEVKDFIFDYAVIEGEEQTQDEFTGQPGGGYNSPLDTGAGPVPGATAAGAAGGLNPGGDQYGQDEEDEEALHLMAVGVEKIIIEDIRDMLRKAGLKLVKTAPALSAYISLIRDMENNRPQDVEEYGILDLGHHGITMYMFKHDQHVATREFDIGLSQLEDIIADKYGVERHLAHTYIHSNFENCLASEECMIFYDNVSVELMRAINFYEFSNQDSSLNDMWICGGGAVNEPLLRTIYETLEMNLHSSQELLPGGKTVMQYNSLIQAIGVTLEI